MRTAHIGLIAIVLLLGIANAGTVTLTASCSTNLQPGNVLNFSIINTGNDTAYNLLFTPMIHGAQPENQTYTLTSLSPNVKTLIPVELVNRTRTGTYVDSFTLAYQQGTQTFTALFPCMVNLGQPTTSGVYLNVNTTSGNGMATVNVSVFNGVQNDFTVNVSALVPPSISFASAPNYIVQIGPYQTKHVVFALTYPQGVASYGGAIVSHYIYNNLSYSNLVSISIANAPKNTTGSISTTLIGATALVVVVVLLIARSIFLNKKKRSAEKLS
ncbi:MAG: hypothetical protein ACREBF_00150 [Candidatus Micrarchaeales archaeon]